jgi:hypothetical protein
VGVKRDRKGNKGKERKKMNRCERVKQDEGEDVRGQQLMASSLFQEIQVK